MFGLDFIRKLKPCKWRYRDALDDGVEHFGFIAQEVDEVVSKNQYAFVDTDFNGMLAIRYGEFIGPIVKAIQELDDRIMYLENKE